MAKNDGGLRQISVQDGGVTVTLGRMQATVPSDQIDTVIRALEAAKIILGLEGPMPEEEAPAPARPVAAAAPKPAPPAPARAPRGRKKAAAKPQKRSRKRVGDALVDWFRDNPGWHSTEELLHVVSSERMTDASPKRALMIALGKQRDSVFAADGEGNWKLAEDPAPALAAQPKVKKKPGRKPGAAKKAAPTRAKRATGRPRGRPPKSASSDKEGSAFPQEVTPEPDIAPARVLRVKRGQARKDALLTPQELEARRQAATAVDTMQFRWTSSSRSERDRIRKNLFGDGLPKLN
jgi:hypothetical protein